MFTFAFNINSLKKSVFVESFRNGQFASNEIPTTNYTCQKIQNVCLQHEPFEQGFQTRRLRALATQKFFSNGNLFLNK